MAISIKSQSQITDKKQALLLGAGYCARAIIPKLISRGYEVVATTRSETKAAELKTLGVMPLIYKGHLTQHLVDSLGRSEIILSSIPPDSLGDPFLNACKGALKEMTNQIRWAGYLSATSVYGDRKGGWVYEDELLRPKTQRGKNRAAAEIQWLETGLPVHVFRLAGIYGPGRSNFRRLREGKARAVIKAGHVVNRIHVDDIVSLVLKSIERPNPVTVYNVADGHPAPPQDVINFSADLLNLGPPPQVNHNSAQISDMARSFYTETKKVDINRARNELMWAPQYDTYRKGLMAILKKEQGFPNSVWMSGVFNVPKNDLKKIMDILPHHIKDSVAEKGCIFFRVSQDEYNPQKFGVFECFDSAVSYQRHQSRVNNSEWSHVTQNCQRDYDIIGL